ncbi:MAG: endonuclease domain-containing protein [candidate division WOR-3 bacterium]|nr:MAG: endonuclease domain-containing protein [candidate division WOR-3 bacterium]
MSPYGRTKPSPGSSPGPAGEKRLDNRTSRTAGPSPLPCRERAASPGSRVRVEGCRNLTAAARRLRLKSTDAERRLWSRLRRRQVAGAWFRRQHPIPPYIVDFACLAGRIVIEVDGGHHAGNESDWIRDEELARRGYRVLRFWDSDVLRRTDAVLKVIDRAIRTPSPQSSPKGRGSGTEGTEQAGTVPLHCTALSRTAGTEAPRSQPIPSLLRAGPISVDSCRQQEERSARI